MEQGSYLKISALLQHHIMNSSSPCWHYLFCYTYQKGAPLLQGTFSQREHQAATNIIHVSSWPKKNNKNYLQTYSNFWEVSCVATPKEMTPPTTHLYSTATSPLGSYQYQTEYSSNWLLVKYLLWILISLPR